MAKKVKKKAKKATKKMNQTKVNEPSNEVSSEASAPAKAQDTEQLIKMLIARGKKRGFLTYEEMNDALPDDAVSPSRLERILGTLDEMGVRLVDEDSYQAVATSQSHFKVDQFVAEPLYGRLQQALQFVSSH